MRLDEYQWSRNPRGLHVKRVLITPLEVNRWSEMAAGWAKLVAAEYEYTDDARELISRGITPVLRLYRDRWGAKPFDMQMREETLAYMESGVKWFEFYNEPNLPIEWPPGTHISWQNSGIMVPMIENWLNWAEFIISQGCYPGFIALAETDAFDAAAVRWYDTWLNYLAENHYDRFRWILANGGYCATHPYILNHFYQERPGGGETSARPPGEQNGDEGGWHFEYPYDPICQRSDPGRTVTGGTALTPNGDPVGLLAMGRLFNERCARLFNTQAIPVLGTEGGIYPFPRDASNPFYQQDNRYPGYTHESQAEATVAMFNWIPPNAPPWFFGVCLWKEDDYFEPGPAKAVTRMRETPQIPRMVPAIPVIDGDVPYPFDGDQTVAPGPAPIHGTADFHMLILAPGLDTGWFLDSTQAYWEQFRPIITTAVDLVDFITSDYSLAVTIISPPESADSLQERIADQYPNVWFDLVIATSQQSVAEIFRKRAERGQRFG